MFLENSTRRDFPQDNFFVVVSGELILHCGNSSAFICYPGGKKISRIGPIGRIRQLPPGLFRKIFVKIREIRG